MCLVELAHGRRQFDYCTLWRSAKVQHANRKRIYRLYREARLAVRRRRRRHGEMIDRRQPALPGAANEAAQNAYAESFNGKSRDECPGKHWFTALAQARAVVVAWRTAEAPAIT